MARLKKESSQNLLKEDKISAFLVPYSSWNTPRGHAYFRQQNQHLSPIELVKPTKKNWNTSSDVNSEWPFVPEYYNNDEQHPEMFNNLNMAN